MLAYPKARGPRPFGGRAGPRPLQLLVHVPTDVPRGWWPWLSAHYPHSHPGALVVQALCLQ